MMAGVATVDIWVNAEPVYNSQTLQQVLADVRRHMHTYRFCQVQCCECRWRGNLPSVQPQLLA